MDRELRAAYDQLIADMRALADRVWAAGEAATELRERDRLKNLASTTHAAARLLADNVRAQEV